MRPRLIVLMICWPSVWAEANQLPRFYSSRESQYLRAEIARLKTDDRIALIEKRLQTRPGDPELQIMLADTYLQKMRETTDYAYVNRASKLVEQILSVRPDDYECLRLNDQIEMQRHEFARAAEHARQLLDRNPRDSGIWGILGDALMETGKYEEAGAAYLQMSDLRPDLFSLNRLAYYRFVTGDASAALLLMQQAVAAGSSVPENNAWCLVELGDLFFKTGRLEDAAKSYTQALAIFPGYHRAHAGLGRLQAARGNQKAAIENYQRAQAAVPFPEYAGALESLYRRSGRFEEAKRQIGLLEAVDKLMRANGEKANRTLALTYADHDRNLGRALELVRADLDLRQDVYTLDALAWVLYKNGEYAEAEVASRKALAFKTPEPVFYYHAGMIALALGKKLESKAHLDRALALNNSFDSEQAEVARKVVKTLESSPVPDSPNRH